MQYIRNMPAAIKLPAALVAEARAIATTLARPRALLVESRCFGTMWIEDVKRDLAKAARAPKFFGSFDRTRVLTWAATLGYDVSTLAVVIATLTDAREIVAV